MAASVRGDPRISISKLGEYLTASPRRRRSIVADQKRPSDYVVIWYLEARRAIIECILADGDAAVLQAAIDDLDPTEARPGTNDETRIQVSIDGIDAFARLVLDDFDLSLGTFEKGEPHRGKLVIGGAGVSISPDLVTRSERGIGAVVLYFNKTYPLTDQSGTYVAALLHQFVETSLAHLGNADRTACKVIDVLQGTVYVAPVSYKSRRKDIEAACQEIAALWPGL